MKLSFDWGFRNRKNSGKTLPPLVRITNKSSFTETFEKTVSNA